MINWNFLIKRTFAYIFDIYLVTLLQLICFSAYTYIKTGVLSLSMFNVLTNYRLPFILVFLLYFFFLEYKYHKTLGKKIFGLEILWINKDLKSIFIRTITRLFPLDVFFVFFIQNQLLHDFLSKTQVVNNRKNR